LPANIGWKAATAISAAVATGSLATLIWSKSKTKNVMPERWVKVGTVSEMYIYPIKSCRAMAVPEAEAAPLGLKVSEHVRDRVFMVVDSKGELVRMTEFPKMVFLTATVIGQQVLLSAPEVGDITFCVPEDKAELRRSCSLWGEKVKFTLDCGPDVSDWLTKYLGKRVFLCYHPGEQTQRQKLTEFQKRFWTFSPKDKGTFQDETSYMLTTQKSLDELNTKLATPVTHLSFRPSLVVADTAEAFAEEKWGFVKVGENGPVFKVSQPCLRCKLTTIDPETGKYHIKGEPLRTLHHMKRKLWNAEMDEICRKDAVFGIHLGLLKEGDAVKVGDAVYAAVM